ncbi:uncharacterized protein LOC132198659 [Neocloeon triangulifer]|uniref:uncharacterized protein LOC132198659 n=1 Tax=Neocloeon triangulifer TaxID=2078957 RepID=UPI00286F1474|nr:uncharacterized protein LOC132198659 [Neocloeon triangulifer]
MNGYNESSDSLQKKKKKSKKGGTSLEASFSGDFSFSTSHGVFDAAAFVKPKKKKNENEMNEVGSEGQFVIVDHTGTTTDELSGSDVSSLVITDVGSPKKHKKKKQAEVVLDKQAGQKVTEDSAIQNQDKECRSHKKKKKRDLEKMNLEEAQFKILKKYCSGYDFQPKLEKKKSKKKNPKENLLVQECEGDSGIIEQSQSNTADVSISAADGSPAKKKRKTNKVDQLVIDENNGDNCAGPSENEVSTIDFEGSPSKQKKKREINKADQFVNGENKSDNCARPSESEVSTIYLEGSPSKQKKRKKMTMNTAVNGENKSDTCAGPSESEISTIDLEESPSTQKKGKHKKISIDYIIPDEDCQQEVVQASKCEKSQSKTEQEGKLESSGNMECSTPKKNTSTLPSSSGSKKQKYSVRKKQIMNQGDKEEEHDDVLDNMLRGNFNSNEVPNFIRKDKKYKELTQREIDAKFDRLSISTNFKVHEEHTVEPVVKAYLDKALRLEFKKYNMMPHGKQWIKAEDELLLKNWETFRKTYGLEEEDWQMFQVTRKERKDEILTFYRFLGQGLPSRPLQSISRRFIHIKIHGSRKKAIPFTREEDEYILHVLDTCEVKDQYSRLAKILDREKQSVRLHCLKLLSKREADKTTPYHLLSRENLTLIVKAIMKSVNASTVHELSKYKSIPYRTVADELDISEQRIYKLWTQHLYHSLRLEFVVLRDSIILKAVDVILENNWDDPLGVDWEEVARQVRPFHRQILSEMIRDRIKRLSDTQEDRSFLKKCQKLKRTLEARIAENKYFKRDFIYPLNVTEDGVVMA